MIDTSYLCVLRAEIERQYEENPTHCGASFGEILCWEIHSAGLTFSQLSEKWGVSLPTLGELIWDHCKRLEEMPRVNHGFKTSAQGVAVSNEDSTCSKANLYDGITGKPFRFRSRESGGVGQC